MAESTKSSGGSSSSTTTTAPIVPVTSKTKGGKGGPVKAGRTRKKACGLVLKTIDIEMFRVNVTFALRVAQDNKTGFTASDVEHFYDLLGEGSRDAIAFDRCANTAGFFHSHNGRFLMGTLMYAEKGETFPRMDLSTVAHETDHCATGIMNYLGMNIHEGAGDECHAYIHGHLMRHLYKFLIANNVIIFNGS